MKTILSDAKLLSELDMLIKEQERVVKPDAATKAAVGALLPGIGGKLFSASQQVAVGKLETLTRAKNRLAELIENEHQRKMSEKEHGDDNGGR